MTKKEDEEVDIYRDTPGTNATKLFLRLLGYANEVGEAFRALVHVNWVRASYGVASLYVLADTRDKAVKMMKRPDVASDEKEKGKKVAAAAFDTLVWQALASVIIPGFTINRICAASLFGLARLTPRLAPVTRKWITTGLGLGTIPFIVHPIDSFVHLAMDKTTRVWIGGGPEAEK